MKNLFKGKWALTLHGIIVFLTFLVINVITYLVKGDFRLGSLLGSLTGLTIIALINGIYVYYKRVKTPEIDERVRNNMIKYIAYASQIVFILFMVILTVVSFMGIKSISNFYLWIGVWVYMFIMGIGAMIVKFR